jgi:hypothetical protein
MKSSNMLGPVLTVIGAIIGGIACIVADNIIFLIVAMFFTGVFCSIQAVLYRLEKIDERRRTQQLMQNILRKYENR